MSKQYPKPMPFIPSNKEKYRGNVDAILWRSSWELKMMHYFDKHPSVIWWSSEELFISYLNPIDKRMHKYFPDFIVKMKSRNGSEVVYMIEIKPHGQTIQPVKKKHGRTKRFLNEMITYTVNQAKWRAADLYCQEQGWTFKILTERHLFEGK